MIDDKIENLWFIIYSVVGCNLLILVSLKKN